MKNQKLLNYAKKAIKNAYAPYSKFHVGAAIITKSGKVFTGCNIENSSYGLTICAERVALFNAISGGEKQFQMMAIVTDNSKIAVPCGACLQVIAEFAPQIKLMLGNKKDKLIERNLLELLSVPFKM